MYKETKDAWIKSLRDAQANADEQRERYNKLSQEEQKLMKYPRDTIEPVSYMGWFTNSAMVLLIKVIETMFGEKIDFNPKARGRGQRHAHFDLLQELSGIDRLDPLLPSFEQWWRSKGNKEMPGVMGKLSLAQVERYLNYATLADLLEKDIIIRTEPLILPWKTNEKAEAPKEVPKEIPKESPKVEEEEPEEEQSPEDELLDDLPF